MNDADEEPIRLDPHPPADREAAPRRARGRRWLWILLLVVLAAVAAAGYVIWRQLGATQAALEQRLEALAATTEQTRAGLDALGRRLDNEVASRLDALERAAADLEAGQRRATGAADPWDVENLLRIANDSLQLARDPDTALQALRRADQRLRALDDPAYAEARRRLAQEIAALEAAPRPDISGMAFDLAALESQLEGLGPERARAAPTAAVAAELGEPSSGWRAVLHDWWRAVRSLVVIRRTEGPPLLAPEQRVFLLQNLHAKLESARLALLARDDANYHVSLQAARDWLARYYDTESPAVAALADRLAGLDRTAIRPQYPDISGSLEALHAALERRRHLADGAPSPKPGHPATP